MCSQKRTPESENNLRLEEEMEEVCFSFMFSVIQLLKTNNCLVKKMNQSNDECRKSTGDGVGVRVKCEL